MSRGNDRQLVLGSERMHLLRVRRACLLRRKLNSCKTSGKITRNWGPFKNITSSLFPQQGVDGRGNALSIRTGDELAIKLLIQTMARSRRQAFLPRIRQLLILEEARWSPGSNAQIPEAKGQKTSKRSLWSLGIRYSTRAHKNIQMKHRNMY